MVENFGLIPYNYNTMKKIKCKKGEGAKYGTKDK